MQKDYEKLYLADDISDTLNWTRIMRYVIKFAVIEEKSGLPSVK